MTNTENVTTPIVLDLCGLSQDELINCKPIAYPSSYRPLQKASQLWQNGEATWVEAIADFEEEQAECLLADNKEGYDAFAKAFAVCRWMSEESGYLPSVYPGNAEEMREVLFRRMDRLRLRMEVCCSIGRGETKSFLEETLRKVEASGHLWHGKEVMEKIACFLSYDIPFLAHSLPLISRLLHSCHTAGLLDQERKMSYAATLERRINVIEGRISDIWFSDNREKLHPLITEGLHLLALFYLLTDESDEGDIRIISARICRYLSRLPSAYSELLKNKAYTLLAGETTLNGRIRWDDIRDFDEIHFLERIILFHPDEEVASNLTEPDNKWAQCHNKTNTLTLDHDGFALSPRFPHDMSFWKGRKDKASVLNNRFFVASFAKLPLAFDDCKGLKNYRLYWKQLEEDFPTAYIESIPLATVPRPEQAQTQMNIQKTGPSYPDCGQKVTVRVLFVDHEKQRLQTEITDLEYRGMKACLTFSNINACHTLIPGFASLFTEGMRFVARVKQADNRDVKLTLLTSYNEFVHAECMRQRKLTGRVTELFDGKVRWLLSSGAATVTGQSGNKYKLGDYYKVWYNGLDVSKLTISIKLQLRTAMPDESAFLQPVANSLREFITSLVKDAAGTQDWQKDLQELKEKNNPFVIALQNLDFRATAADEFEAELPPDDDTEEAAATPAGKQPAAGYRVNLRLARELLYCLDLLTDEVDKTDEKFNTYNALSFLSRFTGDRTLADYYLLCADYLYQVDQLTEAPCDQRFTRENVGKLSNLLKRMELSGISRYNLRFGPCGQIIRVLEALFTADPSLTLRAYIQNSNRIVSELARYLCITLYLRESDEILQQQAYKNINRLLGLKEAGSRTLSCIPVFFGHEGEWKEFKTSAFIHADKYAGEEQFVVLARVLASFMNTDGGTLYIGVNDSGYLSGLKQELKHTHNDSDVYLRTVHHRTLRYLGENDDWNRYQEYIRCRLYEYEDGRQVLAFRAAPINEVVMVKGCVYTRSASSNTIKPISNVPEFIENRRNRVLDSTPRRPEFPTCYSSERQEFIFGTSGQPAPSVGYAPPFVDTFVDTDVAPAPLPPLPEKESPAASAPVLPVDEPALPTPMKTSGQPAAKSGKFHYDIATSTLRTNPLQKKGELGYTPKHLFVSVFSNGKIAASPSPKIGVWGEDKGKVFFSYNPDNKEDLLVSVYTDGQVGISNLKQGISMPNTPTAFLNSLDQLLFLAPARKKDYLFLLSEKDDEVRYRLILIDGFNKAMGIQPQKTVVLEPDKGTFIYAEIIPFEQMKHLNEEKISLDDYDRYNAGRNWKRSGYEQDVKFISQLCKFSG